MSRPIYVSIWIRTGMESIWERSQNPDLHGRWDLRFTSIEYLPKAHDDDPQRFRYTTRLGFGINIEGWGESIASRSVDELRTSSLKFGSEQPRSLIREGSGYWKYTDSPGGIGFETGYDYRTRWGIVGRLIDTLVFRPMIGWATAWSFDRLRLWLERGIDPALSAHRALTHSVSRLTLAIIFLWHGLVPKLIVQHPQERLLVEASGFGHDVSARLVTIAGVLEVALALVLILFWRVRWLYMVTGVGLIGLMLTALVADPGLITHPFTPVTLTIAMLGLCAVGWVACVDLPSARRCNRSKRAFERRGSS